MERPKRDIFIDIFAAFVVFAIVASFVVLVIVHIIAIYKGAYPQAIAYQETIFIELLMLGLMIVLIIPHLINKKQVKQSIESVVKQKIKQEIEDYWKEKHQKFMDLFVSKSQRDYAHTSRMIAYILMQKKHYYWAMAWAGDSVVAYIKRFNEHPADFQLNEEYFNFSLKIIDMFYNPPIYALARN